MKKEVIKCEKCGNEIFIVDQQRTGLKNENPLQPLTIDGYTTFSYKTYMKCDNCGWELPNAIDKMSDTVICTLEIKK